MSSHATGSPIYRRPPGILHTIFLAGTVPLFLGALLNDIAYFKTYQIQWSNFASWLIAGGLLFAGLALLFALGNLVTAKHKKGTPLMYFVLLLTTWILGLVNAFVHAKDAWAIMPAGLFLSVIVLLLSCAAVWVELKTRSGGQP